MKLEVTIKDIVDFYTEFPEEKSKILVNTPFGYKKIEDAKQTDYSKPILVQTDKNNQCISSLNHRYKISNENIFEYAKNLNIGDKILGKNGLEVIINIKKFNKAIPLYDLQVEQVHQYYSNGLVSHNSVFFVDSIIFALFGKTLKNTNNQYIPNRNCPSTLKSYVKLYFEVDGQLYTSECFCKPKIGTVGMELKKYNPNVEGEWEDITQSSVVKTRQYIQENILGCSFDIFKSSIIVSTSDCLNFYEGMGKQAKRNYIENIFNLNCFGIMFSEIKADLNDLKKELTYTNNEIVKSTQQLEQLQLKYQDFDKKLNKDILDLKNKMIAKYSEVKTYEKQLTEYNERLSSYNEINDDYNNKTIIIKDLNNKKTTLDTEIIELKYKVDSIKNVINEIEKIKMGLCQTCISVVNERYKYDSKKHEIENLNTSILTKVNQSKELKNELLNYNDQIHELNVKLSNLNKIKLDEERIIYTITHLKQDIKQLKNEYDNLTNDNSNPFGELINKTQMELETLKIQMLNYIKNIKHLEILKDACSENGVKRFIIKDIVKLLNSLIQKYLNEIGAEYLVYFDESFEFKFVTMSGECEFSNFSTGERCRIQIATMLAFRDLILNGKINSNLFVIDEVIDTGIDSIGIKNVLSILHRKAIESNQNILLISHRSEVTEENLFNHIIEVIKENGISTLKIN